MTLKILILSFIFCTYFQLYLGAQIQIGSDIIGPFSNLVCGNTVSLSDEGNKMAVSCAHSVSVYKYIGGDWIQMGEQIDVEDSSGVYSSLSANGERVVIGDYNSVRVFEYNGTNWIQLGQAFLNENPPGVFGHRVSISNDGLTVVVGIASNIESLLVYRFINNDWIQIGQSISQEPNGRQYMGMSVSISSDGNTIAVVIEGESTVKVFKLINNEWIQLGNDIQNIGFSGQSSTISLSADGQRIAIGASGWFNDNFTNFGRVRVFEYSSEDWIQVGNTIESNGAEYLGNSVSLSNDGNTLGIGASTAELARVYKLENSNWIQVGETVSFKAYSVSLSGDGNIIALGDPSFGDGLSNSNGQVRVFRDFVTNTSNINDDYRINIYPNPTSGISTIDLEYGNQIGNIILRDFSGRKISQLDLKKIAQKIEIKGVNGLYLIDIVSVTGSKRTYKIIKTN